MEIHEVLDSAADLVEKGWTQGSFAKTDDGHQVFVMSNLATCFCASGAVRRASRTAIDCTDAALEYFEDYLKVSVSEAEHIEFSRNEKWCFVAAWNDASRRKQAEVVAALRGAADQARRGS